MEDTIARDSWESFQLSNPVLTDVCGTEDAAVPEIHLTFAEISEAKYPLRMAYRLWHWLYRSVHDGW
jgi:hypothetical protein